MIFSLSLLLLNAVEHSSCERFTIVPSPDSPCPGEFTGEPCLTLQQYVANPSLSSNITFELQPGNHRLDSQISIQNMNSFIMRANASATVTCNQQLQQTFYFNRVQQVHVSGISFSGCRMELQYLTNVTFERSSFVDGTSYRCCYSGRALYVWYSSVLIRQCIVSNNRVYRGAIYGSQSNFVIEQTTFRMNHNRYTCCADVHNGAAINCQSGNLDIVNSTFSSNSVFDSGLGAAIYTSSAVVTITGTHFNDNRAGRNGGAVYFGGSGISITNSTFINNRASGGGGGAIYSANRYTNISLINNIFSRNTAAYCGVMEVAGFNHYDINITGNSFFYNRAVQQISGNNAGGVICIRNASVFFVANNFSRNSAAGDAGVIQADESNITIERSIFSNNTAGGNGGVLHTYFYPTRYTIVDSTFTNNQAGGDGGVMYVGRAGSHVTIDQGIFGFNMADRRGGVIAIIGSTLEMNSSSIFRNTAALGDAISACNSNASVFNLDLLRSQDPTHAFCSLYNKSTTNVTSFNYTVIEIDYDLTTAPTPQVPSVVNIIPSVGSPCPGEFTGEPCFTLEQYAVYPPSHQSSNIVFELHPGTHHLNSQLSFSNIHSFTMRANTSATVTILCRGEIYNPFYFDLLQLFHVSEITFIGCSMNLRSIANATIVRSSLINTTTGGAALYSYNSSVWIEQCTISNNSIGAIDFYGPSSIKIDRSIFSNNGNYYSYTNYGYYYHYYLAAIEISYNYYGGISSYHDGHISILNSIFEDNEDITVSNGEQNIFNCTFKGNDRISLYHYGNNNGTVSILNSTFRENRLNFDIYRGRKNVNIVDSTFENTRARHSEHGGAIYFNGGNVTVYNSNFINNTASGRGGGAIYFETRRTHDAVIFLVNNTFSHNSAAYCGAIKMTEFNHFDVNITGNTFTHNRATDQHPGNNGGGVICARNASIFVIDNNFSHNSAAGDAGVIQVDESDITIERSIFSNNTAGGNGGALQTYFYPTNYTIVNSSFSNNRAGGDGGVMYVGRAGCHVTIYGSTFSHNHAAERGGVIAIIGSTLQLNRASIYENSARAGEVINSCNSNVVFVNPRTLVTQGPIIASLCAPYNDSSATVSPTTAYDKTTPIPTTEHLAQESTTTEDLDNITTTESDDTTEEGITMATTTPPQSNNTEEENITMATTSVPQPNDTTKEDVAMTTTALPQDDDITSKAATRVEDTPHATRTDSSTNAVNHMIATSLVNDRDTNEQDAVEHSLHMTVPGYVAIGISAVVLVLFALFGAIVLVKLFKIKTPEPQKVNRLNFSTYEYPTVKNEFTLPEVHLVST